jgi:PAS domain S-box-containing protein
MFELAGGGTARTDPATDRFVLVNRKMGEIIGYSEEELLSTTFSRITHPEDRQENFDGFPQAIYDERPNTKSRSASCARTDKSCG